MHDFVTISAFAATIGFLEFTIRRPLAVLGVRVELLEARFAAFTAKRNGGDPLDPLDPAAAKSATNRTRA